jgi:hypothetical protein
MEEEGKNRAEEELYTLLVVNLVTNLLTSLSSE